MMKCRMSGCCSIHVLLILILCLVSYPSLFLLLGRRHTSRLFFLLSSFSFFIFDSYHYFFKGAKNQFSLQDLFIISHDIPYHHCDVSPLGRGFFSLYYLLILTLLLTC